MEGIAGPRPLPRTWAWLSGAVLLLLVGCRAPRSAPPGPAAVQVEGATPAWIHQPLSWDKLDAIAAWLEGPGRAHSSDLVIEGELQLNEGRVLFTDRDQQAERIEPEVLRARAQKALGGFELVLANPQASRLQIQRAETGKRAALALLESRGAPASLPEVLGRSSWGASEASARRMTPVGGPWSRITVHHSAERASRTAPGSLSDSTQAIQLIQKYHMQDPGHLWGDIGYHFLVDSSGRVFEGRELRWQGAHAGGANNRGNIGVCVLGDFSSGSPSPAARRALETLIEDLRTEFGIPPSQVFPHNDFGGTECPGPWLTSYLARYR